MSTLDPSAYSSSSKNSPVVIMNSVMGGLQVLLGGAALGDFLDVKVIGLLALIHAAVLVGWGIYTKGTVTRWDEVVAKSTPAGLVVAGPAANETTGREVVVTSAADGDVVAPPVNPDPEV